MNEAETDMRDIRYCAICEREIFAGIWAQHIGIICFECARKRKIINRAPKVDKKFDFETLAEEIFTKKVVDEI